MIDLIRKNKLFFMSLAFMAFVHTLNAQNAPFVVADALFDQSNKTTLGLEPAEGTETVTVFAPTDHTDKYSNGVVLAAFKGNLYCMWQSSAINEDSSDTWVAYSRSTDDGKTWSNPMVLAETLANGFCSSGGWLVTADKLVGYINTWDKNLNPNGGYTRYVESTDGLTWTAPADVLMHDGSRLNGIFEQDPHVLPNGRIVNAAHFLPWPTVNPIYTDDLSGVRGWKKPNLTAGALDKKIEPSLFLNEDGTLVMVFRDQNNSNRTWASTSTNNGETWSVSVKTNLEDSRAKQSAGNLPDGTAFIVNNPSYQTDPTGSIRVPLAITLSADGKTFTKAHLLRASGADLPSILYPGGGRSATKKTPGYSYPKSMIYNDYLYVSYSTNKEYVQYTRVPLQSLSLNTAAERMVSLNVAQINVSGHLLKVILPEGKNNAKVILHNLAGYKLFDAVMHDNQQEYDLSAYPAGTYILSVITDSGKESKLIRL